MEAERCPVAAIELSANGIGGGGRSNTTSRVLLSPACSTRKDVTDPQGRGYVRRLRGATARHGLPPSRAVSPRRPQRWSNAARPPRRAHRDALWPPRGTGQAHSCFLTDVVRRNHTGARRALRTAHLRALRSARSAQGRHGAHGNHPRRHIWWARPSRPSTAARWGEPVRLRLTHPRLPARPGRSRRRGRPPAPFRAGRAWPGSASRGS